MYICRLIFIIRMASTSLVFQLILAALLVAYAIFLFKSRLQPKYVRRSALAILAAGVALNMYGLYIQGFYEGFLTIFGRALVLSIKMFVYTGEVFEMSVAQKSPYFLDLYYFVFYAAILTSVSAIILLFGKRAMTMFTLFFRRSKFNHVFIGVSSRAQVIARGIKGEDIAFIEFPSDEDNEQFSVSGLLKGFTNESSKESVAYRHHLAVLRAKRRFGAYDPTDNIFATIGLERLKRLTDSKTAFYILSENTERNLNELMALLSDKDLMKNTIHVCLSREGVARYYKTILKHTGVHFIYPSSMAVVELMKNPAYHPAQLMKPVHTPEGLPTGTVDGAFNAMVIGFGETGQAVAKFLYEFTAAVRPDGSPLPVRIMVNDVRIDSLLGPFSFDNPAMCTSGLMSFSALGTESSEFWKKLSGDIDELSYIAISLNEDAASLDLACTIFMYALKHRRNGLDGLRIVVRKKYTPPHEVKLVEKMNERAGRKVIVCYGESEKVFTPEMVVSKKKSGINRSATALADKIAKAYSAVSGDTVRLESSSESFHDKNRARMELHQMISRANHVASLSLFAQGADACANVDAAAGVDVGNLSESALQNLSRMEHLRYQRYLTAHGYSYGPEDDDVFKTNHQICEWSALSDDDRRYHLDMVRAQLSLL